MKLLTKEILNKFEKQGYTGEKHTHEITVIAKFFGGGAFTWYLYEYDPIDKIFMAFVNLGDPMMAEMGSVSLTELEDLKFPPLNLPIERDLFFEPMLLSEVIDLVKAGGPCMIDLKVKQLPPDLYGRPRLKNVENRRIYADVSCGDTNYQSQKYNIPGDWYITSKDGEPYCPLKADINFILIT